MRELREALRYYGGLDLSGSRTAARLARYDDPRERPNGLGHKMGLNEFAMLVNDLELEDVLDVSPLEILTATATALRQA